MKKQYLALLVSVEIILAGVIGFLGYKIWQLSQDKVKGVYITRINKDDVTFDSSSLKYFYEPKSHNIEDWTKDWVGYEVKNTINADSLNERYDYTINKNSDTYRIITLGDSFTFGQYVNTPDNYSEVLEDLLNKNLACKNIKKFEVINLGVYGYDIDYEVERFRKRGVKYNPDLVIWLISNGNFLKINEKVLPLQAKLIKEGYKGDNPVTKRSIPLVEATGRSQKELGDDYLINYQSNKFFAMYNIYKGKLLILNHNRINNNIRETITNFTNLTNNFSFFENMFSYLDDKEYKLVDGHPKKDAHKKMAEDIFTYLTKGRIIDCN